MRVMRSPRKLFMLITLWSVVNLVIFSFNREVNVSDKGPGVRHLLNFESLKKLIIDSHSSFVLEEDTRSYTPVRFYG